MGISYKTIFLFIACVFVINLSIAAPPVGNYTEVKNVPQGEGLNGLFYINDVSANYNIWFAEGKFYIDNPTGATDRTLKIKYVALENKFGDGVNRLNVQHKNDFGVIDSEKIVTIGTKDAQGFVYITGLDFSTIIIGGVSSIYTQNETGIQNGTIVYFNNLSATGNITLTGINLINTYYVSGNTFTNNTTITVTANGSNITNGTVMLFNISWQNDMQLDMDDLNFTNSSGGLLPHWKENVTNGSHALVHVRLNDDGNQTVYMYSGNSELGDGSNGNNTHPVEYSDFESGINGYSAGTQVSTEAFEGTYSWKPPIASYGTKVIPFTEPDYIIEYELYIPSGQSGDLYDAGIWGATNKLLTINAGYPTSTTWGYYNGSWYDSSVSFITDTWVTMKYIIHNSTSIEVYQNDDLIYNGSYRTTAGTAGTIRLGYLYSGKNAYVDAVRYRKYIANEPTYSIGASQNQNTTIYFTPTGHPTSENKTTNASTFTLNSTANSSIPVSAITVFCTNNCTFNGTFTFNIIGNYTLINKNCADGVCNYNLTSSFDGNYTNANYTIEKVYPESFNYFQNLTVVTNDENYTGITENYTHYVISSSAVNSTTTYIYNISVIELPLRPLFRIETITADNGGHEQSGSVNDTYLNDSNVYVSHEKAGDPWWLNITFNLTDSRYASYNNFVFNATVWYDGNPAHHIDINLWNDTNSSWEQITNATTQINDSAGYNDYQFTFSGSQYRNASDILLMQYRHDPNGTATNHYFNINQTSIELYPDLPTPTIAGSTAVCGVGDAYGCANLNSTNDTTYSLYNWEWKLNGSSAWNSSTPTSSNTTSIELTKGVTYDFRLYASDGYDFVSDYSNIITIIMATGNPVNDLILANQATIISNQATILSNQEDMETDINSLWGGFIIFAILVISWIRQKLNTSNYKNEV